MLDKHSELNRDRNIISLHNNILIPINKDISILKNLNVCTNIWNIIVFL